MVHLSERKESAAEKLLRRTSVSLDLPRIPSDIGSESDRQSDFSIQLREELEQMGDNIEFTKFVPTPGTPGSDNLQGHAAHQKVIIFDWDDTLFPTSYLKKVVRPTLDVECVTLADKQSVFHDTLAAHAQLVKQTLSAAASEAQVYIVTLGRQRWVEDSSDRFLPGLDMRAFLKQSGIRVYYAREHVTEVEQMTASCEEGVDEYTIAKRNAMNKCIKKARRRSGSQNVNVIAVGDSTSEIEAIHEVMWADDVDENLCKSIKFVSNPTIETLTSELSLLQYWIAPLLAYDKDIDLDLGKPDVKAIQGMLKSI